MAIFDVFIGSLKVVLSLLISNTILFNRDLNQNDNYKDRVNVSLMIQWFSIPSSDLVFIEEELKYFIRCGQNTGPSNFEGIKNHDEVKYFLISSVLSFAISSIQHQESFRIGSSGCWSIFFTFPYDFISSVLWNIKSFLVAIFFMLSGVKRNLHPISPLYCTSIVDAWISK
jgi:hypothetical protein